MDPDLPDLTIADVVISTAGRDGGKLFYVLEADDTYLLLVDGKGRRIEKPKRKKLKHVQIICEKYDISGMDDVSVKRILKLFDKETGKYLRQIGHLGDDPEGYLTNVCFIHPEKEEIGFPHHDELVKYDLDGRYIGEMDFPAGGLSNSCYPLLGDSSALVYI